MSQKDRNDAAQKFARDYPGRLPSEIYSEGSDYQKMENGVINGCPIGCLTITLPVLLIIVLVVIL
jgi:hypothetical protein